MTWLFVTGYLLIIGIIMLDEPTVVDRYQRMLVHLHKHGIDVSVHHYADGTVKAEACKMLSWTNVRHMEVTGTCLLEVIERLLEYIEKEINEWLNQPGY